MRNTWLNYHHLFYFKTIAEELSVSKAAMKLRLGQPTLSAQLKQFESALDTQLFERQHKKLILTEQGQVVLDYAREIFTKGSEMLEVIRDGAKLAKPTVQIGALDSVPKQVVLQIVKAALRISPCQFSLVEAKSDELLRELSAHRLDLILTNFIPTATDAKGLYHRMLVKRPVAVFAAPKFKSLRKGFPESIQGQPMLVPTYDSKLRYDLDHWSRMHSIHIEVLAETQDIALKKLIAMNGLGLIPTATHTVTKQLLTGDLVEIGKLEGVYEELFLVRAKRKIENVIAAKLMKTFQI